MVMVMMIVVHLVITKGGVTTSVRYTYIGIIMVVIVISIDRVMSTVTSHRRVGVREGVKWRKHTVAAAIIIIVVVEAVWAGERGYGG